MKDNSETIKPITCNIKFTPDMFKGENVFRALVIAFFPWLKIENIDCGYFDFYLEEKIFNMAYVNQAGAIIAQRNFILLKTKGG